MNSKGILAYFLGIFVFNGFAQQPGALDSAFNSDDVGFGFGDGANGWVFSTLIQPDGKIIIGGTFDKYNGTANNGIVRLNEDGYIDTTFRTATGDGYITCMAMQNDGKVIIGGAFSNYNGTLRNCIARINTDGSLDTSFNPGTAANNTINAIFLQGDGRIILGGQFTSYNGITRNRIARINPDGSLDASFNPGTAASDVVNTVFAQGDGKLIIGGAFTYYNGISKARIARINPDGSLDLTFNTGAGTGVNKPVNTSWIQGDSKIIIGGEFTSFNGTPCNYLVRLDLNGALDTSFNIGTGTNSPVSVICVQNSGKILIGGGFTQFDGTAKHCLARLNANGSLDTAYPQYEIFDPTSNPGSTNSVLTISAQANGKVIAGGGFINYNGLQGHLVYLNPDGSHNSKFNTGTGVLGYGANVYDIVVQNDGKILIGGEFTAYNGKPRNRIARLNMDGSIDTTFNPGTGTTKGSGTIRAIAVQKDKKILIGGHFGVYNGMAANQVARLNEDGALDTTFNVGTGPNGVVYEIAIQQDGKIIIGGSFPSFNGQSLSRIARLNSDGSVDTTFKIGTGASNSVTQILIQADGKIIIAGGFTLFNGFTRQGIARLNDNGTLDLNYDPGSMAGRWVKSAALQQDGKLVVGGSKGLNCYYLARINVNGNVDSSFCSSGTGANSDLFALALQADGKIVVGGIFTSFNGVPRKYMARVNADGSLDTSFDPGSGPYSTPHSMSIDSNGGIIIGGEFHFYNGKGRNRIARLVGNAVLPVFTPFPVSGAQRSPFPNPSSGIFRLKFPEYISQIDIINLLGEKIYQTTTSYLSFNNADLISHEIDLRSYPKGVYFYRASGYAGEIISGKIIIE